MVSTLLAEPAVATEDELVKETSAMTVQDTSEAQLPPHRSHDPQHNMKRADPFQFGSRYLQEDDDVFEFNAWDHVETDDAYKEYAEQQFEKQRQSPVSDFDKSKPLLPRNLSPSQRLPVCSDDKCIVHLITSDDHLH